MTSPTARLRPFSCLLATLALASSWLPAADRPAAAPLSLEEYRALRTQAANRPRHVIFNNDGNEPVRYAREATAEALLGPRTAGLVGSRVNAIFYCTWSSGFSLFTHFTKVGQVFTYREGYFAENRMADFVARGVDPLRVMTDFGRQHGIEVFWSLRVNDTHDASSAPYGAPLFQANRFKVAHPEYLMGSATARPKVGSWSAVDFSHAEVRDLTFRFCEEVCREYDVAGIELDFFRHLYLFKSSSRGEACTPAELAQLTDLMRRIRTMTEQVGRERRRPFLVAVRVPDSVAYARHVGIDLERWLSEGLVDLLVVGGYVQLNPWETSVALARRHGVKIYPSLDESRVRDDASRELRMTNTATRGRVRNAWAAGVDGIYFFNRFNPADPAWRESADPQRTSRLDRDYFVSVRGRGSVPVAHDKFQVAPTLNPQHPVKLAAGPAELPLRAAEDFARPDPGRTVTLRVRLSLPANAAAVQVGLNGTTLPATSAAADGPWLAFPVDAKVLRPDNTLSVARTAAAPSDLALADALLSVRYAPAP